MWAECVASAQGSTDMALTEANLAPLIGHSFSFHVIFWAPLPDGSCSFLSSARLLMHCHECTSLDHRFFIDAGDGSTDAMFQLGTVPFRFFACLEKV